MYTELLKNIPLYGKNSRVLIDMVEIELNIDCNEMKKMI